MLRIRQEVVRRRCETIPRRQNATGRQVTGDVEVYRGKLFRRFPTPLSVRDDSGVGIERFLLSLGVAKKAVPPEMMEEIQQGLP